MKISLGSWFVAGLFVLGISGSATAELSPARPVSFAAGEPAIMAPTRTIPWFILPGRFLLSGAYFVKLSVQEMRIDHMTDDTRCTRKNRTFMISAAFAQPIGRQLFSSGLEIPLFSADRFAVDRLAPASVGDYVLHLSNTPLTSSVAQLMLTARF
jgi:hypothetical protein